MKNLTPCVDIFFGDQPLLKRLELLSEAGFIQYEMWSWWDKAEADITRGREEFGIAPAACCTRFVSLTDHAERDLYVQGLSETMDFCKRHGIKIIISQVGNELSGVSRGAQHESIVAGLRQSAEVLKGTDLKLVIEPLNLLVDHQGYYLSRSDEAAQILQKVDSPNVKMLFDVYHQQITEGNVISNLRRYADLIGHYHIADVPGRHEPGTGELNYRNILDAIDGTGYTGHVGLEFFPSVPDHNKILRNFLDTCC